MFELMELAIEMQRRLIDAQAQTLKATNGMMTAAKKQNEALAALGEAGRAQAELWNTWSRLWGIRP